MAIGVIKLERAAGQSTGQIRNENRKATKNYSSFRKEEKKFREDKNRIRKGEKKVGKNIGILEMIEMRIRMSGRRQKRSEREKDQEYKKMGRTRMNI